ncbi:hypothetical protein TNCV_5001211 [Trichonephila clavipes]|nr:hypothetical protein TNCV_5001211 [Trichonephila clavipes]
MAANWAGLVTSQAKPAELYFQKVSKALGLLGHGSTFANVHGHNALRCSEVQGDFRLRRLGCLLGFLVSSLIAGYPNMTPNPL